MLLLSSSFQTIRITQGVDIDVTADGPDIDSVQILEPAVTRAVVLEPGNIHIETEEELIPDTTSARDLKPSIASAKDLKPVMR